MPLSGDLKKLQGDWSIVSLEVDGRAMPEAMLGHARIVIKRDRFVSSGMGADYEGELKVVESASPRRLDMKFVSGPESGNTNLAIYEFRGDELRICIAMNGTDRPKKFATTPGSGFALETLVRTSAAKPEKKAAAAESSAAIRKSSKGSASVFDGEWAMVSGVFAGQAMDASMVSWVKRLTSGGETTVLAGPQTMLKVKFTHDASTSPASIDYVNLAGSHKGKAQQGIYNIEGSQLTVCIAPPGRPRPQQFVSTAADGNSLTVWRKS